jgi:hypothetical protein
MISVPDQYAFVPGDEFGSRRIQRSVVPVERNVTIVIETTNVTNITYANATIIDQGPNYEEMRSHSQQPIERYRLERQVNSETTVLPMVRGEVLVMSAPAITTVQGVDRPQTVKETITQAMVEKSWAVDTDRSAADRARAKMKAEVTPPPDAPSKTFVKPAPSSTPARRRERSQPRPARALSRLRQLRSPLRRRQLCLLRLARARRYLQKDPYLRPQSRLRNP